MIQKPDKSEQLDQLLELCGHYQDGSCTTVIMGWDDATRMFIIQVDKRTYWGSSFSEALANAVNVGEES